MGKLESRFPLYSKALRLYPAAYQKRYGKQTLQTLADMLDDPEQSKPTVWTRAVLDLPLALAKQNLIYVGGIMKNQTPQYVKRNSIIASGLIAPFFALIIVNSLFNHVFDFGGSWRTAFIYILVGLPALALVISAATFIKWATQQKSFWKSLIDFRRNWLLLIPGGLALLIVLFVPFHDSSQCVNGNPVRELRHLHETWSCVSRGN